MKEHHLKANKLTNNEKTIKILYNTALNYVPFPSTGKIPHNLQPTEKLKQTSGRRMRLKMEVLSTDMMGELDILGHYCNALHADCTKVSILQKAGQIILCSFLQSQDHTHLEVQIIFANFLGNFVDQMQKGALVHEELSALLELADLTEDYYPWPVLLGPLQHASLQELLSWGLASHGWPEFLLGWLLPH